MKKGIRYHLGLIIVALGSATLLSACDPSKIVAGVSNLTPAQDAMLICLAAEAGETASAKFDKTGNAICTLASGASVIIGSK